MSAVSAPTSVKTSVQNAAAREEPSSWKGTLFKVGTVVLCALIPLGSLFIAYWIVPETWAVVVIPFVAILSIGAAVFGCKYFSAMQASIGSGKPREPLPLGAPRGIVNSGNNCWAIALAQTLYADVGIRNWLMSKKCPHELKPFHDFMHAYDQAVTDNAFVVTMKNDKGEELDAAQKLRKCFADMRTPEERENGSAISSRHRQEDASEGWQKIYDFLPDRLKLATSEVKTFHQGLNPFSRPAVNKVEYESLILPIVGNRLKLQKLMHLHCNVSGKDDETARYHGFEFQPDKTVTKFVSSPPSLWIQFKRFEKVYEKVDTGNDYSLKVTKIVDPIEIPADYELPMLDNSQVPYKLRSFLAHYGKYGGGHYISCTKSDDGQWYQLDDSCVTPISEQNALELAKDAYMVQYAKVDKKNR